MMLPLSTPSTTSDPHISSKDGLLATPSTSLPTSVSEAARPPVPPPSGVDVTDERAVDSKAGLYWERQLAELKEREDAEDRFERRVDLRAGRC